MSLKAKMAAKRAAKEQQAAERQLVKAGRSSKEIVAKLRADRSPINLDLLAKSAAMFDPANDNGGIDQLLDKPHFAAMHAMVREQLEGDWMSDFRKLLDAVKPVHRLQAQAMTFEQWLAYGYAAGLDERGLMQALQVVLIFRKSLDRNKLVKPKLRG